MENSKLCYISFEMEDGVTITDSEDIANSFCHYFAYVGPNQASKIISLFLCFIEYFGPVSSSSLQNFDPGQINELVKVVKTLRTAKLDNLPLSTIKRSFDFVCEPLVYISTCL